MLILNANVEAKDDKYFIKIDAKGEEIIIPMSDDKPGEVKSAFNKLLSRIKSEGEFQINLEEVGEDLFSLVANEYITQLNREIHEVYGEMKASKLA